MDKVDSKFDKCFFEASEYVRGELFVDRLTITDDKIRMYCLEFDNKIKKVKSELQKHAEKMKQINFTRLQKIPLSMYKPCKFFF